MHANERSQLTFAVPSGNVACTQAAEGIPTFYLSSSPCHNFRTSATRNQQPEVLSNFPPSRVQKAVEIWWTTAAYLTVLGSAPPPDKVKMKRNGQNLCKPSNLQRLQAPCLQSFSPIALGPHTWQLHGGWRKASKWARGLLSWMISRSDIANICLIVYRLQQLSRTSDKLT